MDSNAVFLKAVPPIHFNHPRKAPFFKVIAQAKRDNYGDVGFPLKRANGARVQMVIMVM